MFFILSSFVFITRPDAPFIPDCRNFTLNSSLLEVLNRTGATPLDLSATSGGFTELLMTSELGGSTLSGEDSTATPPLGGSTLADDQFTAGTLNKTATTIMMDEDVVMMTTPNGGYAFFLNGTRCRLKDGPRTIAPDDQCFRNSYETSMEQIRVLCEIALVIWSVMYIIKAVHEATFLTRKVYLQNMALCPSRVVFLLGCIIMLLIVPFRLACNPLVEDRLAVMVMLCTGPYFLFFCRGFKLTGPFVSMIYRMMAADLLRFVTIYFIFVMGFSQAYYIIFQSFEGDDHPMDSAMESIIAIFMMSLGNFGNYWDAFADTNHDVAAQVFIFSYI